MSYSLSTNRRSLSADSLRWLVLTVAIAILAIVLDALSKWLVTRSLGPGGSRSSIQIAGDFVELHYARNGGVAFGLLSGSPVIAGMLVVLVIVPLVIVLVLLAARGPLWSVAAGMVLGGAAGNLLDRLGDQTVTDFISVGRWPSFNLADSAITAGALLLIGLSVRDPDRDRSAKP